MTPIAVFVKTPGLSPVKTRLAQEIGIEKAEKVYRLCCEWTKDALIRAQSITPLQLFWAVAEEEGMKASCWTAFDRIFQGNGTLGERLYCVYETLVSRFGRAIVIGADSPELDWQVFKLAAEELAHAREPKFVMGKTEDGGFYLFGGNKKIGRELWTSISYSQNSTAQQLSGWVQELGKITELPTCADVDYFSDLKAIMTRLKISDPKKYSALLALDLI